MQLDKSKIIIVPDEGYCVGLYRKAVNLHYKLNCPILVSGADRNPDNMKSYGLKKYLEKTIKPILVSNQISRMLDLGIDENIIMHEDKSYNTKENAINSLKIIESKFPNVKQIHLTGSLEGMLRKKLTFKKTLEKFDMKIDSPLGLTPQLAAINLII